MPQPAADAPVPAPIPDPRKRHALYGKTLARCVVGERIGRGATSSVFRARYKPLDKDVALKVLSGERAGEEAARARFLDEARAVAQLDHENVVKVLDVAEDRGNLCILMEMVDGETVQDLLDDDGPLPPRRALKIALDVARALEAAHAQEIVHRDIKPANFILDRKSDTVKVVDFGLAAKGANNRVGTPLYMSPEAAQGKRIDDRSDVYALGVSLYQMLTGKHPFTGPTVKEILASHVSDELVPPSRAKPDVGNKYDALLGKLLVKAKGYRPSAAEVVEMLEPLVDEPRKQQKGVQRRGRAAVVGRKKSQTPMWLAIGGIAVLGIAAFVLATRKDPPPADPTPVVAPVAVPEKADPEEEARKAFLAAQELVDKSPNDLDAQLREWTRIEKAWPTTDTARQAAKKREFTEEKIAARRRNEEQARAEQEAKEKREREARAAHAQIAADVAAKEFAQAATKVKNFGAPEGVTTKQWRAKATRLEYLAKHFLPKLDEALKIKSVSAQRVKPAASPDENLVGADRNGFVTDRGGHVAWSDVSGDDLFHKIAKKVLSQRSPDDCLFLAVLAAELGLEKEAKQMAELVPLVDQVGEAKDRLKDHFPE